MLLFFFFSFPLLDSFRLFDFVLFRNKYFFERWLFISCLAISFVLSLVGCCSPVKSAVFLSLSSSHSSLAADVMDDSDHSIKNASLFS